MRPACGDVPGRDFSSKTADKSPVDLALRMPCRGDCSAVSEDEDARLSNRPPTRPCSDGSEPSEPDRACPFFLPLLSGAGAGFASAGALAASCSTPFGWPLLVRLCRCLGGGLGKDRPAPGMTEH